jgi:preprotein translocase subunit YajC
MFISTAWAQGAGGAGGGGLMQTVIMMALIFGVFYFLMIRPQQKKVKAHREMIGALRRGDKIVTAGGIYGTVSKVINEIEVAIEIAEGVRVRVARGTITEIISKTDAPAAKSEPAAAKSEPAVANDTEKK